MPFAPLTALPTVLFNGNNRLRQRYALLATIPLILPPRVSATTPNRSVSQMIRYAWRADDLNQEPDYNVIADTVASLS